MTRRAKAKIRIQDVAKRAGVSVCTVSRVFNKHPNVTSDVCEKVLNVARKLNYKPKFKAVEDRISILVESTWSLTHEGYEGTLISSILSNIIANGFAFDIVPLYESNLQFERFSKSCIAVLSKLESIDKINLISKVPVVTVNYESPECHSVCSNHYQGIVLAVNHLVSLGHSRIGFISFSPEGWGGSERFRGYKETLASADIPVEDELIGFHEHPGFFECVAKIVQQNPTALIVSGENRAAQAVYNLSLLGKKIPDDISLITFESDKLSPFLLPPNTTISQELQMLGKVATETAIDLISSKQVEPLRVLTDNKLIIRESTKALSI